MNFVLPSKAQAGYLDPEIAGEGQKVILSDGEQIAWNPPPPKPVMPDWSQIKSIARYFGRSGHQIYPAWLYHPTEKPRLVKNSDEAGELGVCYREATVEEKGRYGRNAVWDWQDDSKWRPQPHGDPKFDPANPGLGKTYMPSTVNPSIAQNQLLEALIPTVTAAVVTAMKASGPSAPANIDAAQWDAFLQFQAFQKTAEAVDVVKAEIEAAEGEQSNNALSLTPDQDRALWETEADNKGIKVDKRWSLDRLKSEVQKKSAA